MSDHLAEEGAIKDVLVQQDRELPVVASVSSLESLEEQHLQEIAQTLVEFKLVSESEKEKQYQEIKRLRGKVCRLTASWFLSVFILGGTFSWVAYRLQTQQQQLAREITSVTAANLKSEQYEQLESQLKNLSKQVQPNLATELKANQEQLAALEIQVEAMTTSFNQRQKAIAVLAKVLQDLANEEVSSTVSAAQPEVNVPKTEVKPSPSAEP